MASTFSSNRRSPFNHLYSSVDGMIPGYNSHYNNNNSNYNDSHELLINGRNPSSAFKFNLGTSASETLKHTDSTKETVLVTVRFRPLSVREMQKGDEVAWYAEGDAIVRSEYNPAIAYGFDRVFGPATTTKSIYDVAAKNVVHAAMEGINGAVFAYGVTSSGKTHTMHGDLKSPGIIPLAVRDVFRVIQENPNREYLLRLSYLEIYNEIINDLLNPIGQNLRIREDSQGTYVEGLKEEVLSSPTHALSLIAAGEEHRHVGSNNFNLLSSRSHTVFTLTVESRSRDSTFYDEGDEVTISQLNLIDLAGSESSKTETTGLRMKEGSYINKSLLTLGTVIGKLSEGRSMHVPYRDSKLTRLLQSSLGGNAKVSLICTLTPASSNMEETHNTLKFAQRAKRVTVQATPNRIVDEKQLLKRYQKEIVSLKEELNQLKRGTPEEDLISIREEMEAGQLKLRSRLEEEERAKAALVCRIQRLTKLILVSTLTNATSQETKISHHRRRHSFGDEKFVSMDERRRAFALGFNDDAGLIGHALESPSEGKVENIKDEKKNRRRGILGWLKFRKNGSADAEVFLNDSLSSALSQGHLDSLTSLETGEEGVINRKNEASCSIFGGESISEQMDLLREQLKMLAREVAFCTISEKRSSNQATESSDDVELQESEISVKEQEIRELEQRIIKTGKATLENASSTDISEAILKLMSQLNEKEFELEIKIADNRTLQDQLENKSSELKKLQRMVVRMQCQHNNDSSLDDMNERKVASGHSWMPSKRNNNAQELPQVNGGCFNMNFSTSETRGRGSEPEFSDSESYSSRGSSRNVNRNASMQSQMLKLAAEVENLKQEKVILHEENGGLQVQCQKLAEEASYAKELASAAAAELRNLAEEVTKLSFENSKLSRDLAISHKEASKRSCDVKELDVYSRNMERKYGCRSVENVTDDMYDDIDAWNLDPEDVKQELYARKEREKCLELALADKEDIEIDLRKKLEMSEKRESDLENDLAGMWVQLAKLKKEKGMNPFLLNPAAHDNVGSDVSSIDTQGDTDDSIPVKKKLITQELYAIEELQANLEEERKRNLQLSSLVSRLKSEELEGLHLNALEELQQLHVDALTKLFQAKARTQDKPEKGRENEVYDSIDHQHDDDRNSHVCKICFEAPTAAVLLPCRHFCLCKRCAVACTECPLCRSGIADRIITFTS